MEEKDISAFFYRVSYAQNKEDIILDGIFKNKKKGFYIDVGASHPRESSVTKIFYDRGWSGINIEPSTKTYKLLQKARPRDTNLNIGVSDKAGYMELAEFNIEGLHTFSEEMLKEVKKDKRYQGHKLLRIKVATLAEVCEKNKVKTIDFLKVDVEGMEYQVFKGNDWDRFRPKVICVEANHVIKDWRPLLNKNKYTLIYKDELNEYYADSTLEDKLEYNYVKNILEGGRIVKYDTIDYITSLRERVTKEERRSRVLTDKITTTESKIKSSQAELEHTTKEYNKVVEDNSRLNSEKSNYYSGNFSIRVQLRVMWKSVLRKLGLK